MSFDREIRDFSTVRRWATLRTIQSQNVAEHSFYVALYSLELMKFVSPGLLDSNSFSLSNMLEYALAHDKEELFSGDTPGPFKRDAKVGTTEYAQKFLPQLRGKPGNDTIVALVKIANIVDELLFLSIELSLGNRAAGTVRDEYTVPRLRREVDAANIFKNKAALISTLLLAAKNHAEGTSRRP